MAPQPFLNLVVVFTIVYPTRPVPFDLGSLSKCAFHLLHFHHPDLSESILASNQHGQPWTVYNVSRPLLKECPKFSEDGFLSKLEDKSLHLDESRLCNVHL